MRETRELQLLIVTFLWVENWLARLCLQVIKQSKKPQAWLSTKERHLRQRKGNSHHVTERFRHSLTQGLETFTRIYFLSSSELKVLISVVGWVMDSSPIPCQRCPCPNFREPVTVTLHGKINLANVIQFRILRWADYLWISHEWSEGSLSVKERKENLSQRGDVTLWSSDQIEVMPFLEGAVRHRMWAALRRAGKGKPWILS